MPSPTPNLPREMVFELFQDLDRFNLGDYRKYNDEGRAMQRLVNFMSRAIRLRGGEFSQKDPLRWQLKNFQDKAGLFTTDRDLAIKEDALDLIGLEHPVIRDLMNEYGSLDISTRGIAGKIVGIHFIRSPVYLACSDTDKRRTAQQAYYTDSYY